VSGPAALARRLVVGLAGPRLTSAERAWLDTYRPAGVILYRRNVRDGARTKRLCAELHDLLPRGAEIMADHEGGPVSVLDAVAGRPPAPWLLGRLDDPELTRRVMEDAAARARAVGVDRLLAPCMDVLTAPDNPIIGARSFAASAERVARHVAAAVRGITGAGLGCCLKHWPGHGGTVVDTHLAAAGRVRDDDPAALRAGLEAGADAVMLGHLRRPGDDLPASVCPDAVAELQAASGQARLFSDDLTMGALRGPLGETAGVSPAGDGLCEPADLPRAWFEAAARGGCDLLFSRGIPWSAWPLDGARPEDLPSIGADVDPPVDAAIAAPARPASWDTALERAAAPCLDPQRGDLLLWRASSGHRWGGLSAADVRAAGWTGGLSDLADGSATDPAGGCVQVLVASHAPLRDADLDVATPRLAARLGPSGVCVALGHPSLAGTVAGLLPRDWRVEAGFDLDGATLAGFFAR